MTMTETTNIIKMPAVLDTLAAGIHADLKRTEHGRREWIEGTLGLAAKLKQARREFGPDIAFGLWIKDNAIGINHQDRAALINMAADLDLAKDILRKSERTSWRHIWEEEMMYRFTQAGKPGQEDNNIGDNSASILEIIKNSAGIPGRQLAQDLGVSHGRVQRARRKFAAEALGKTKPSRPIGPSLAEQMAIRNARPRFDEMTREERGMGSKEYGAQQAEGYPDGWTNDAVHREKYGRIQLYTPAVTEERNLSRRFTETIGQLIQLAENSPEAEDLDRISDQKNREMIMVYVRKLMPHLGRLNGLLQKLADAT